MKKISTVVPVYNESENVPLIYQALKDVAAAQSSYAWEFVFINDGSRDDSWKELQAIAAADSRVMALDFSRNFGKELALTAGVRHCTGDAAIFLDADLQHPPALIPEFLRKWEQGAEVVASLRKSTEKKSLVKQFGSWVFYRLMNSCAPAQLTPNATDFKLVDRKVINELVRFTEHKRMFRGLIEWLGFRTEYVEFVAPERLHGKATYSLGKLVSLAVNSMASFSLFPLKVVGYLGVTVTLVSTVLLAFMILQNFILHTGLFSSIAFVIVANTLVLGVVLIALGLMALYVGQIHDEVINRPLFVIREKLHGGDGGSVSASSGESE
ncbi:MAG: glycosyltransferase family 2 protein [Treponema sp.]|jgi:dolichol-phosphate mannosyltransferase|nr:glycosyltransferase family 2 protein [Treponema sp.]